MLNINERNRVTGEDIHQAVESKNKNYRDWLNDRLDYADLQEGKDFFGVLLKSTGGRPKTQYEFTLDAAKEICLLERNEKGKQIRRWLIEMSKQVETAGLVSHAQVMAIVRMIKVFSVYEFRQKALAVNKDNYVANALAIHPEHSKNPKHIYAEFHNWRNHVLHTGKEELAERVKEYCLVERKRIPARFTQDEALVLMGEYEMIKNAIWDVLSSKNQSEEMINNICNLAHDLAKEVKPFLERLNESNLFFDRISAEEVNKAFKAVK